MIEAANDKTYGLFSTPNNKKLIADLEAQGKKIIKLPAFETRLLDLDESSRKRIQNLSQFDWIIFPDVLTVDCFLEILEESEADLFELDEVRICAFGEAVSDRLRFVQIHTDVLPIKIDDLLIIEALKNYVNCEDGLSNQNILMLRQENKVETISKKLIGENANVFESAIYRITTQPNENAPKLKALISGGAIDEFIFSAPEDIIYLKYFLNIEKIENELFEQFTATNETTFKKLFELGIKPHHKYK
jgi:uroporphyrinogen-III synthase